MATQPAAQREQLSDASLRAARRGTGWFLLWWAAMLGLLTCWVWDSAFEPGVLLVSVTGLLALASAAGFVKLIFRKAAEEAAARAGELRAVGLGLIGAAALLAVLGLWVGWQVGLSAFGEASSMIVLGLIAAGHGAGRAFLLDEAARERALERVGGVLGSMAVPAAALVGAIVYIVWRAIALRAVPFEPWPVAALLFGCVALGVWGWYISQASFSGRTAAQSRRLLVLVLGGALGLLIALATVWQAARWWGAGDIFSDDTPLAQSSGLWRLWLCLWLALLGLGIVFGSLLLARVDIRQSAVMRRLLYGYNAVFTGLLLLATLVIVNIVVYVTYPLTFEWSRAGGLHSLSSSTKNLLEGLKQQVSVYVLMSPYQQYASEVKNLLDNAQAYTRRLNYEFVSPDKEDARYRRLAGKYPAIRRESTQLRDARFIEDDDKARGVLIVYNPDLGEKAPNAFISARDLGEMKRGGDPRDPHAARKEIFKGEDAIMTQLRLLAERQGQKPKIYFTQGNREFNLKDSIRREEIRDLVLGDAGSLGAGLLFDRLKKENYDVRGLLWGPPPAKAADDLMAYSRKSADDKTHQVPADAKVVVIAQPMEPFAKDVVEALEAYADKGGKLVILMNPVVLQSRSGLEVLDVGLNGLLKKFNVQLGHDFLVRFPDNFRTQHPLGLIAQPPVSGRNKVAFNFRDSRFAVGVGPRAIGLARSVRPVVTPGTFEVETLLQVQSPPNGIFWAETNFNILRRLEDYLIELEQKDQLDAKKSNEPIPVVVAVSDRDGKARLVVFGDARFASNRSADSPAPYYDFLVSSLEWLAERPGNIGIRPKETAFYVLQTENLSRSRVAWLPLGLTVLMLLGLGGGIWVVRRR
ncbi:MAG: Gldg family protein [Gemmataceae bacterium]|nr:Gldg family protein [Gemmataceae bacterium]